MKDFELLDCTIRDGSYVINFQYTKKDVAHLVKGLAEAGVPKIEVGHGVGFDAHRSQYNPARHSEEDYITTASLFKNKSKVWAKKEYNENKVNLEFYTYGKGNIQFVISQENAKELIKTINGILERHEKLTKIYNKLVKNDRT
ncbi:hypothetical protein LCGC14_0476800 [marine sediment metagenome]|uniref:Pyruvate carboxyltransferase domain-containing protein n=1 Tax=marine sediment metagenome TaxID=412755 RepID=A0A0F9STK7_9ZZZZ